jgi:hypothetical protein
MTRIEVMKVLSQVQPCLENPQCRTCHSMQKLFGRLSENCSENIDDIVCELKISQNNTHPSLGCSGCIATDVYAEIFG